MKTIPSGTWIVRYGLIRACTLTVVLCLLSWSMRTHAQNAAQAHIPVHRTSDWSTRHMVYSAPSSPSLARKLEAEPRHMQQWTRRNTAVPQVQSAQ